MNECGTSVMTLFVPTRLGAVNWFPGPLPGGHPPAGGAAARGAARWAHGLRTVPQRLHVPGRPPPDRARSADLRVPRPGHLVGRPLAELLRGLRRLPARALAREAARRRG